MARDKYNREKCHVNIGTLGHKDKSKEEITAHIKHILDTREKNVNNSSSEQLTTVTQEDKEMQ